MPNRNTYCDGSHCRAPDGEVRVYPLGSGGNLILCHACFAHENKSRYLKGVHYGRPEEWPQVNWTTAQPYPEDEARLRSDIVNYHKTGRVPGDNDDTH